MQRAHPGSAATDEACPAREGDGADAHNFPGPLSMYLAAGFQVFRQTERTLMVHKRLDERAHGSGMRPGPAAG